MLENFLNSKLKRTLLEIFFALPQRSFSLFELRALCGGRNPQLGQGLRELVKAKVVNQANKRQKRFFGLNRHFALRDELQSLVMDDVRPIEDPVGRIVRRIPRVKLAVLCGIFAGQPQLQIDLLLVGDGISEAQLPKYLAEIEKLTGQEINYSVLSAEEYEHRRMMNDRFIRDVLDFPHIIIFNELKK